MHSFPRKTWSSSQTVRNSSNLNRILRQVSSFRYEVWSCKLVHRIEWALLAEWPLPPTSYPVHFTIPYQHVKNLTISLDVISILYEEEDEVMSHCVPKINNCQIVTLIFCFSCIDRPNWNSCSWKSIHLLIYSWAKNRDHFRMFLECAVLLLTYPFLLHELFLLISLLKDFYLIFSKTTSHRELKKIVVETVNPKN